MAETHTHHGSIDTIPSDASLGLLFLKSFLPIIDSLNFDGEALSKLLTPDATFNINHHAPMATEIVLSVLSNRSTMVAKFGHELDTVWDIAKEDGTRTVLYQSTSTTVFKDDSEELKVKEFNVIELVSTEDGLKAWQLRTYMDASPIENRAKAIREQKAQKT